MDAAQIIWGSALLVLFVFAPGLAITLAVFPKLEEITWVERIGLGFVFGFFPHLLMYFLSKNFSIPMTTATSLGVILLFTAGGILVWKKRT